MVAPSPVPSWQAAPEDILRTIFGFLSLSERARVSQACKSWNRCAWILSETLDLSDLSDATVHKALAVTIAPHMKQIAHLRMNRVTVESALFRFDNLISLDLSASTILCTKMEISTPLRLERIIMRGSVIAGSRNVRFVSDLVEACPRLKYFDAFGCSQLAFDKKKWQTLKPTWPDLETLILPQSLNFDLLLAGSPNLKVLHMTNQPQLVGILGSEKLEELLIRGDRSTAAEVEGFQNLIMNSPNLRRLDLSCFFFHPSYFAVLATHAPRHLTSLGLQINYSGVTTAIIDELATLSPQIEDLQLRFINSALPIVERISGLGWPSLKRLRLYPGISTGYSGSNFLCFSQAHNLKTIELYKATFLVDNQLEQLLTQCAASQSLESLTITKALMLTDRSAKLIAQHGSNIREFVLSRAVRFSDAGFRTILEALPALRVLSVTSSNKISSATMQAAAKRSGDRLRHLSFALNFHVDNELVSQIAQHNRSLLTLNLAGCPHITDASVKQVQVKCATLSEVNFSLSTRVSPDLFGKKSKTMVGFLYPENSLLRPQSFL